MYCYAIVLVCLCVFTNTNDNEGSWADSYILIETCEPRKQKGAWCDWNEWSPCDETTCTRKRIRNCNCPPPRSWEEEVCDANLPQNEFQKDHVFKTHTRFIRQTITKQRCQIPFFQNNEYFGDCTVLPGNKKPVCKTIKGHLEVCDKNVIGQEETDVGTCGDWRVAQGWSQQGAPANTRQIILSNSNLGKLCFNEKLHKRNLAHMEPCTEQYFLSVSGQQNVFSNLNNLAFNIDNCRFACAIQPTCSGIEFAHENFCILLSEYKSEYTRRHIGTITELKPAQCREAQTNINPVTYPYGLAVHNLKSSIRS